MIFLCLIFMVILILFIYKNLSSRSIFFLCTLTIGWILAYISFTLYLAKFNYYYNVVNQFIDFNPGTWNNLVLQNFDANTLIRLFNLGLVLFYVSFLSFSISFVSRNMVTIKRRYIYALIGILGLVQFLHYDPSINLFLQDITFEANISHEYEKYIRVSELIFTGFNFTCIIISFALFIYYFIRYYSLKSIRDHTLYILISLIPITFVHLFIFYWAPFVFVRTTFSKDFINYIQPPIDLYTGKYRFFPIIAVLAIITMLYNIYKYKTITSRYSNLNIITKKKIDTASLGVRAFTHAIKNHLLAIRSEAEYLQQKFEMDEDALYSLKLITDSCEQSFQSIDEANNKLKQITLNIKSTPLYLPIEKAIERIHSSCVNVYFEKPSDDIAVYIDEGHISEALYNILKNSVESLEPAGGSIWIGLHYINRWGTVTIKDNGPGINTENLDEIFTPFFSTKPSITNWGIGLSFCHKVVSAHKGKIEVTSEQGKFTQFTILLPLVKKE